MMTAQRAEDLSPRIRAAITELQGLILDQHPDATFRVTRSADDPVVIHLLATVDVEDTDAVLDAVVDRMMELQIAEELPIYVIPVRPARRVEAMRAAPG